MKRYAHTLLIEAQHIALKKAGSSNDMVSLVIGVSYCLRNGPL
jgi:hypothetical protein